MAQLITVPVACRGCGTEVQRKRPGARAPHFCKDCAKQRARRHWLSPAEQRRRYREAHPPIVTFKCVGCLGEFPRPSLMGPPPLRCAECIRLDVVRRHREYRLRRFEQVRVGPCELCGRDVERHRLGKRRRFCQHCRLWRQRAMTAIWRLANPDRIRAAARRAGHKRRAAKRGARADSINPRDIFVRDRWKCGICGKKIDARLRYPHRGSASLDHIVPLSRGGDHVRANVRASHLGCNLLRGNRGGNDQLMLFG